MVRDTEVSVLLAELVDQPFLYGDDIDVTTVADPDVTVLAWANAEGATRCGEIPVITVRRPQP